MYSYTYDKETGGIILNTTPLSFSNEPRPVYYQELDILGFDKYWNYEKSDAYPYMWAEANTYFYRGEKVAKVRGGALYTAPTIEIISEPEIGNAPLRFIDVPAMIEKNNDILGSLVQDTIKKIYKTYMDYRSKVDLFYVAFSGGKDSVVALDLVQRALPHNKFMVLFGDTGMEFPDTYDVVNKIETLCQERAITFLRSASEFSPEYTWKQFGPPAQRIRWCCSVHKTAPQIIMLRNYLHNAHFRGMAFTGIRGDESVARSEYQEVSFGEKHQGQYSYHPILEWNSAELFLYIFSNQLLLNEAYKKGNSRAGCLVCPLASNKNMFFKEQSYSGDCGKRSTTTFNNIILETTSKELLSRESIIEFMNIGGWKARRSGRELSIAEDVYFETIENSTLTITVTRKRTDWKEWIKTLGKVSFLSNGSVEIVYKDMPHRVQVEETPQSIKFKTEIADGKLNTIYFAASLKNCARKIAYCIGCHVCEANCPNGFIHMIKGQVKVDDRCTHCLKCHDVDHGCLVSNSLKLPKGDKKMGSVDRYGNMGIEFDWVKKYFTKKDLFWDSPHGLGTNKIKYLKSFLNDSQITVKSLFSRFGEVIDKIGIEEDVAWALMMCNLAYTSEFNWWIKEIELNRQYTQEDIYAKLDADMSENSRAHIVSAYKNIFISITPLGQGLGLGECDYMIKNDKRFLNYIVRSSWQNPDPLVILYSLYKFAEACGGYYQFTLTRLMNHDIESDGISPTEIFGLSREQMEKVLNGLSINYPEFISASFTLDLDNINLKSDKTSADVLKLF